MILSGNENVVCLRSKATVSCPGAVEPFNTFTWESHISCKPAPTESYRGHSLHLVDFVSLYLTQFNPQGKNQFGIPSQILAQSDRGYQRVKAAFRESAKQCWVVGRDSHEDAITQDFSLVLETISDELERSCIARLLTWSASKDRETPNLDRQHTSVPGFVLKEQTAACTIFGFSEQPDKDRRLEGPLQ